MAEKKSTRALTGDRILTQNVPSYNSVSDVSLAWLPDNGWQSVGQTVGASALMYENYFDLSGYELDDLTLVPMNAKLQDGMPYFYTPAVPGNVNQGVLVLDIISQERLDPEVVMQNIGQFNDVPGLSRTRDDFNQIIMCDTRFMALDTTIGASTQLVTTSRGSFGSLSATAVAKLWTYRFILVTRGVVGIDPNDAMTIPGSRFVLAATIVQEDELPYMMRLKRSYELATLE